MRFLRNTALSYRRKEAGSWLSRLFRSRFMRRTIPALLVDAALDSAEQELRNGGWYKARSIEEQLVVDCAVAELRRELRRRLTERSVSDGLG